MSIPADVIELRRARYEAHMAMQEAPHEQKAMESAAVDAEPDNAELDNAETAALIQRLLAEDEVPPPLPIVREQLLPNVGFGYGGDDSELARALQESLDEAKRPKCDNCARGNMMFVSFFCVKCHTMMLKSRFALREGKGRMCSNVKCGNVNTQIKFATCNNMACGRLVDL